MKLISKKLKYLVILSLSMAILFGINAQAAFNPSSYYEIHLTSYWEAVATDIGGGIIDWESPVYTGQTAEVTVQLTEGKMKIPYTGIEWTWMYEDTVLSHSAKYVIPKYMAGKTITVYAKLLGSTWDQSKPLSINVPIK